MVILSHARIQRSGRIRELALLLVIPAALVAVLAWWRQEHLRPGDRDGRGDASGRVEFVSLPEFPRSPFLNTRDAARYVGSEQCRGCHQDEYDAYRLTGMGRSLDLVDPDKEPPDVVLDHVKSGRRYRVYRRDGQMWHQELRLTPPGEPAVILADHPIPYVIGSGRHSRSYLLQIDGFMVESPITWYTSRKAWGMSPGYDEPEHQGFARAVDEGCLNCHSGRSTAIGGSLHRIQIHETWIGCERCHGPGSLHVERWSGGDSSQGVGRDGTTDFTIVNQANLDRKLSESICSQCHLRATAGVMARGRSMNDFRPGLPLDIFRADYRLHEAGSPMTVVGHVEQMRSSRCYQNSELTCTTCHDPHGFPAKAERVQYYREKCFSCHNVGQCTVDPDVRQRKSSENNCIVCHMPTSDTEIPHLAFTHHRIGIHPPGTADDETGRGSGELVALSDLSAFSDLDRQRMLGLAYMQAAEDEPDARKARAHELRAFATLREVWKAGLRDVDLAATLALLAGREGHEAAEYVEYAINHPDAPPPLVRINALLATAAWRAQEGKLTEAISAMGEVVQLRRAASDWKLLGFLAGRAGSRDLARSAMQKAAEIDGYAFELRDRRDD